MRRLAFLISFCVAIITTGPVFADTYVFDKAHSQILFSVSHQGSQNQMGRFEVLMAKLNSMRKI